MSAGARILSVLFLVAMLGAGCEERAKLPPAPPGGKPGFVTGTITDARGQPLALKDGRLLVWVLGAYDRPENTEPLAPQLQADGKYELPLRDGRYRIAAAIDVPYHGKTYRLPLEPTDGDLMHQGDSSVGIVRDFRLRTHGVRPGDVNTNSRAAYYGGALHPVFHRIGARQPYPAQTIVTVTLTPEGPLVDGSPGRVVTRSVPKSDWLTADWLDIPLGNYTATVTLQVPGYDAEEATLLAPKTNEHVKSLPVRFEPVQHGEGYNTETFVLDVWDVSGQAS